MNYILKSILQLPLRLIGNIAAILFAMIILVIFAGIVATKDICRCFGHKPKSDFGWSNVVRNEKSKDTVKNLLKKLRDNS